MASLGRFILNQADSITQPLVDEQPIVVSENFTNVCSIVCEILC